MIDIHAHILPGLDDGAADWNEALSMAELSAESGVTALVATPHCGFPDQPLSGHRHRIQDRITEFRDLLRQNSIQLEILEGMEIFGTEDTPELLRRGQLTTLNRSRYPLIEFPFQDYARDATGILEELRKMAYIPVVAHPERYQYVQRNPGLLNLWSDMGCLLQINRGSLLGRFGRTCEALAWAMLDRGFVCTVASDAHASHTRTTWMEDVQELLTSEFSRETAELLLTVLPNCLIHDEPIHIPEPDWF